MRNTAPFALALAALLCGGTSSAQNLTWVQMAPATSPSARQTGIMAYDTVRQRVVLFGGSGGNPLGDTWEWDGTNWFAILSTNSPPPRMDGAMIYDAARQRVVLFGGRGTAPQALGDTWEWDGTNWVQRTPATSPPPRQDHGMAYDDARQKVVLFGGNNGSLLSDTWEWDGTNWVQITPPASPSPRQSPGMAYDIQRGRTVLFGGAGSGYLGDTWEWDGISWLQMTPSSHPSSRSDHAMVYDGARQKVVLFGGIGGGNLGDTWEWDGVTWVQRIPATSPSARQNHEMAYDAARQSVVLFGGYAYPPGLNLGDTWTTFASPAGSATATPYGSGCGVPPLGFLPDPTARPIIGQTAGATITNAPTVLAGVAMGWSNTFAFPVALPFGLSGIGMPGCDLLQSNQIFGLAATVTPLGLSFSTAIPNQVNLVGSHAYIQAYAFAPGQNALQIIASNGIDWQLGDI